MSVPANPLLLMMGGQYTVTNSIRLRASNSAYFSRTFGTPTNNLLWAVSRWIKRGSLGQQVLFAAGDGLSTNTLYCQFTGTDTLQVGQLSGGAANLNVATNAVFRDTNAHYHVFVLYDSANATANDRIQIWINGVRQAVTYTTGPFAQNTASQFNVNARSHYFNKLDYTTIYGDTISSEDRVIDGQSVTASSFGATNATTGAWVPIAYGGGYGNNGSFNEWKDASAATAAAIGKDTSGKGNNWTPTNISVTADVTFDQSTDTPTNNVSKLSPLFANYKPTFSNANERITTTGALIVGAAAAFDVTQLQAYAELTITTGAAGMRLAAGSAYGDPTQTFVVGGEFSWGEINNSGMNWEGTSGNVRKNAATVFNAGTYTTNDRLGIAARSNGTDLRIWLRKNGGAWLGSGSPDPVTDTSPSVSITLNGPAYFAVGGTSGAVLDFNTGQRPFVDAVPTGYYAPNTTNLSTPSIVNGASYMNAVTRTGTGAVASVSSLAFQPDFVWIKSRSAATNNILFDSSRGVQNYISPSTAIAETTNANTLTAFNSNGYSLGTDAGSVGVNINTNTYVDWSWKKGTTPGFDIVLYTGNATNRTISHSLGAVPHFMVFKNRSTTNNWPVYHWKQNATPQNGSLYLSLTDAYAVDATIFNSTAPTSSVFSVGTAININGNTNSLIAYLWTSIPGFSLFGSYTGNGSTDGPFIYCGFRPRFLMIKNISVAGDWMNYDTSRDPTNGTSAKLYPNLSVVENGNAGESSTTNLVDILANGFKLRSTNGNTNGANTYVFAAFAENPFKYSNAR